MGFAGIAIGLPAQFSFRMYGENFGTSQDMRLDDNCILQKEDFHFGHLLHLLPTQCHGSGGWDFDVCESPAPLPPDRLLFNGIHSGSTLQAAPDGHAPVRTTRKAVVKDMVCVKSPASRPTSVNQRAPIQSITVAGQARYTLGSMPPGILAAAPHQRHWKTDDEVS